MSEFSGEIYLNGRRWRGKGQIQAVLNCYKSTECEDEDFRMEFLDQHPGDNASVDGPAYRVMAPDCANEPGDYADISFRLYLEDGGVLDSLDRAKPNRGDIPGFALHFQEV